MVAGSPDGSRLADSLDELRRLAYGRPSDGADPVAAQAELHQLRERQEHVEPLPEPEPPPFRTAPGWAKATLAATSAAALLAASLLVATAPVDSLTVFDRQQDALDLTAPGWLEPIRSNDGWVDLGVIASSVRHISVRDGFTLFGYRSRNDEVCVVLVDDQGGANACESAETFAREGIALGVRRTGTDGAAEFTSVLWGPVGEPRFFDLPLLEVYRL